MNFRLTRHVKEELSLRAIPMALLEQVLNKPQEIVQEKGGRKAYQSVLDFGHGKVFLLRAIVDDSADPPVVLTAYRTSRISKYRRTT